MLLPGACAQGWPSPHEQLFSEAFLVFLLSGFVLRWFCVGLETGGLLGGSASQMDTSVGLLEEGLCG